MKNSKDYIKDYAVIIDQLQIDDIEKQTLKLQWLNAIGLFDKNARNCRRTNIFLKASVFIAGVFIPVISGSSLKVNLIYYTLEHDQITAILGLVVALGAGYGQLFKFEERWNHYRKNAELLRNEGENYFGLSGAYREATTHKAAYKDFNTNISSIKRHDVENYFERVMTRSEQPGKQEKDN